MVFRLHVWLEHNAGCFLLRGLACGCCFPPSAPVLGLQLMGGQGGGGAGGGDRLVGGPLPEAVVQGVNLRLSRPCPDQPRGRDAGMQHKRRREMVTNLGQRNFRQELKRWRGTCVMV